MTEVMTEEEIKMHLAAGRYYGRQAACGTKIKHSTEEKANGHARSLNNRQTFSAETEPHIVEAYPCYWCSERLPDSEEIDLTRLYWHVGRTMDEIEIEIFSSVEGKKYLEMETVNIASTDPMFGVYQGINRLRVHNRKYCEGEYCTIHNPSDHHMKDWPMTWRGDRGIMERMCTHYNADGTIDYQIGHPDPDDAAYRKRRDGESGRYDSGIHGCDGCCSKTMFEKMDSERQ